MNRARLRATGDRCHSTEHSGSISASEREQFDRDGFVVIRRALAPDEVCRYEDAIDRVYPAVTADWRVRNGASMHQLSAVANCLEAAALSIVRPRFPTSGRCGDRTFAWTTPTWTLIPGCTLSPRPFWFEWHQDGGWQNREIETDPRGRLSVKLSERGRGNLRVVPGSHLSNWIDGPPRRDVQWPDPERAIELSASPGAALLCSTRGRGTPARTTMRRIGGEPSSSHNTARRIAIRNENDTVWSSVWAGRLNPVHRQLLGAPDNTYGDHAWVQRSSATPLSGWLHQQNLLDAASPALEP